MRGIIAARARDDANRFGSKARTGVFNNKSVLLVLYSIYIAFILVSIVPYIAEHQTRYELVDGNHEYHIVFDHDGDLEPHYFDVLLADPTKDGRLDLSYDPNYHTLTITAINLKQLTIDSDSLYKDEAVIIIGTNYIDDPDFYKEWFIEKNKFTVNVNTDTEFTKLVFRDVPRPVRVDINDEEEWWKTNTNWKQLDDDDFEITKVPEGSTTVVIYFKEDKPMVPPNAEFSIIGEFVRSVNEEVFFDGSASTDDGTIDYYIWDFGDGSDPGAGVYIKHIYSLAGNYNVSLMVIDDDNLDDTTRKTIYIVTADADDDLDGVPNQDDPHPFDNFDTDGDTLSDDFEDYYDNNAFNSTPWPAGGDLNKANRDTDGDGYDDNIELAKNTDPLDRADHPTEPEPDEDESFTGMGATGDIIVILVIVIIIVLIIVMLIIRKRKEGGAVEVAEVDEESPPDEGVKVGPGLVKRGQREMGPGPAISPLKPGKGLAKPSKPGRPTKKPPVSKAPKKPVMPTHPPIKKLSTKPPIQPRVMLDTLEEDSLRKFLPPQPVQKIPIKSPSLDSLKPPSSKLPEPAKPKPIAPKPSMESLVKAKPPTSLKPDALSDQSPAEFKTETITKFAQALGIGKAKASALYNGGFTSMAQLQKATKEELMNVKGIGPKMAERIIKNLEFLMAKRI